MCVCAETPKLFKCGDEFLFIHMEKGVNVKTPRVRFKTIQREERRGGRDVDRGGREKNKDWEKKKKKKKKLENERGRETRWKSEKEREV